MTEKIREALAALDQTDDSQWTQGGSPKLSVLKAALKDDTLTREAVIEAAPQFTRTTPILPDPTPPDDPESDPASDKEDEVIEPIEEDPEVVAEREALAAEKAASDKVIQAIQKAEAARLEAERMQGELDKLILDAQHEDKVPEHVKNQRRIQRVLARNKLERAKRGADSLLDQAYRLTKREQQGGAVPKRHGEV